MTRYDVTKPTTIALVELITSGIGFVVVVAEAIIFVVQSKYHKQNKKQSGNKESKLAQKYYLATEKLAIVALISVIWFQAILWLYSFFDYNNEDNKNYFFAALYAIGLSLATSTVLIFYIFRLYLTFDGTSFKISEKLLKQLLIIAIIASIVTLIGLFIRLVSLFNNPGLGWMLFVVSWTATILEYIGLARLFSKRLTKLVVTQQQQRNYNYNYKYLSKNLAKYYHDNETTNTSKSSNHNNENSKSNTKNKKRHVNNSSLSTLTPLHDHVEERDQSHQSNQSNQSNQSKEETDGTDRSTIKQSSHDRDLTNYTPNTTTTTPIKNTKNTKNIAKITAKNAFVHNNNKDGRQTTANTNNTSTDAAGDAGDPADDILPRQLSVPTFAHLIRSASDVADEIAIGVDEMDDELEKLEEQTVEQEQLQRLHLGPAVAMETRELQQAQQILETTGPPGPMASMAAMPSIPSMPAMRAVRTVSVGLSAGGKSVDLNENSGNELTREQSSHSESEMIVTNDSMAMGDGVNSSKISKIGNGMNGNGSDIGNNNNNIINVKNTRNRSVSLSIKYSKQVHHARKNTLTKRQLKLIINITKQTTLICIASIAGFILTIGSGIIAIFPDSLGVNIMFNVMRMCVVIAFQTSLWLSFIFANKQYYQCCGLFHHCTEFFCVKKVIRKNNKMEQIETDIVGSRNKTNTQTSQSER